MLLSYMRSYIIMVIIYLGGCLISTAQENNYSEKKDTSKQGVIKVAKPPPDSARSEPWSVTIDGPYIPRICKTKIIDLHPDTTLASRVLEVIRYQVTVMEKHSSLIKKIEGEIIDCNVITVMSTSDYYFEKIKARMKSGSVITLPSFTKRGQDIYDPIAEHSRTR